MVRSMDPQMPVLGLRTMEDYYRSRVIHISRLIVGTVGGLGAIGVLLAATSLFLAQESKSLLIGERAHPEVRRSILEIANDQPGCLKANGLFTVQLGPQQILAFLSLEFAGGMRARRMEETVIELEQRIREANPDVVGLFIKPQTEKTFRDQLSELADGRDGDTVE